MNPSNLLTIQEICATRFRPDTGDFLEIARDTKKVTMGGLEGFISGPYATTGVRTEPHQPIMIQTAKALDRA